MDLLGSMLAALARQGTARASDLARQLGVSQPTISRLLTTAGAEVCRMGQGRATRYARTRSLPGLGRRLIVHRIGETGKVEPFGEMHLLAGGGCWLHGPDGAGEQFVGLPPFAADMAPQGYVGRTFSARHPDVDLPPNLGNWNDDHRLIALARRGEDCVGNLVIGSESLDRWIASTLEPVERSAYPDLARHSAEVQSGSSAGGEQPKFLTYSKGRHVLVKFAGDDGAADRRWRDLLVCESLALEEVRTAGLEAATAHWFDEGGHRFLEVGRFDRVGGRGRRGILSLRALDNEYLGSGGSWTKIASMLLESRRISREDDRRIRWLDVFGQLIGNTDRHSGNLSLFEVDGTRFRLAPVYDMLPMMFAPAGTTVVERQFAPDPPKAETLDVWPDAALHAHRFWTRLIDCTELSDGFRERVRHCRGTLEALQERMRAL